MVAHVTHTSKVANKSTSPVYFCVRGRVSAVSPVLSSARGTAQHFFLELEVSAFFGALQPSRFAIRIPGFLYIETLYESYSQAQICGTGGAYLQSALCAS